MDDKKAKKIRKKKAAAEGKGSKEHKRRWTVDGRDSSFPWSPRVPRTPIRYA